MDEEGEFIGGKGADAEVGGRWGEGGEVCEEGGVVWSASGVGGGVEEGCENGGGGGEIGFCDAGV